MHRLIYGIGNGRINRCQTQPWQVGLSRLHRIEITQHLSNFVVQQKGQRSGYGGIQCAGPEAILDANKAGKMHHVAYSLAYDQKSQQYKSACGSCEKYLEAKGITDLHYH